MIANNKMFDFGYKIYSNRLILAIRRGFLKIQHLILIGSIINIIIKFPVVAYRENFVVLFGGGFFSVLENMLVMISNLIKILSVITISYSLASYHKQKFKIADLNPIIVSTVAMVATYIVISDGVLIPYTEFSAIGTFYSIVISLLASEVFIYIWKRLSVNLQVIKGKHDRVLNQSLNALLPSVITFFIFLIFKYSIVSKLGWLLEKIEMSINQNIEGVSQFVNDIYQVIVRQLLWFFGAHGGDIVNHEYIETKVYIDTFVNIGGAGVTLALLIAIFIGNKNKYCYGLGKISILPCLFNINEILLYGLPIIFNPIYFIPFIITPVVLTIFTYIFIDIGLLEVFTINLPWTTPVFINGLIVARGFNGVLLQLINLAIATAIYIPFVKIANRIYIIDLHENYNELKDVIFKNNIEKESITLRDDNIGRISSLLGVELTKALNEKGGLYLEYQPQVSKENKVIGVEALLRWKHEEFNNIPPNITVLIAEEIGEIDRLGNFIIREALSAIDIINNETKDKISVSINVSAYQLNNPDFIDYFKSEIKNKGINPNLVKLEITENLALVDNDVTKNVLRGLSEYGVKLVIDDFGPGYNPILYIKKYNINSIKLDGSLIKDIDKNKESKDIVSAMYTLCENSGLSIVSEFVETESQKSVLDALGDGIYQGHLFSKAVSMEECIDYIKKMNRRAMDV